MASNSSLITNNRKRIYYAPKYWQFDPIYQTNVKLFIKDLLNLKTVQFIEGSKITHGFFYGNHPIQEVDIIATVTAFDINEGKKYTKYTLDDGSATIEFTDFKNEDGPILEPKFDRGTVIRVIGKIKDYNGKREIGNSYGRMWTEKDPNAELLRWLEILTLKKDVYSRPFILPKRTTTINNVSDVEEVPPISEVPESVPNTSMSSSRIFERMKNSDNQSSYTEEAFTDLITRYIYKNNLTRFSIVRIRQSPELNEFAKKVAINQYPCPKPNGRQVAALFAKALRLLVLEGFLNYGDYHKISYCVDLLFVDMVREWKVQM
ncbi:27859_t:CDS:2 [Dentiscutata erythropus]|uniref:CST complex subunit STN1 n=1 Tax=Dentiscutata erythropus TaxID=1348616 RepID=A0A9N9IHE9_9GLOM|nr:27859_t:CDS:2 [Dentiscutata erythropus]